MKATNPLGEALLLLLGRARASTTEGDRRLLETASGATSFLSCTGQIYQFEDFHEATSRGQVQALSFTQVARFLESARTHATSEAERKSLHVALDALAFIEASGQRESFEEYLGHWRSGTLPPVIAAFETQEAAEAWLAQQSPPPYMGRVLIAGEYHAILATRETRELPFVPMPVIAEFIESTLRRGPPPEVASFETREQADAWHAALPAPPRHAFIAIHGQHYLAASWRNVNYRALYPLTLVDELESERRAREERLNPSRPTRWSPEGDR